MHPRRAQLVFAAALVIALLVVPVAQAALQVRVTRIPQPDAQSLPAVWGGFVAWSDYRHMGGPFDNDVFLYDMAGKSAVQLDPTNSYQWGVEMDRDKLVWEDHRDGKYDIYLFDIARGQVQHIGRHDWPEEYPDISGDNVVWEREDYADPAIPFVVIHHDLRTGVQSRISGPHAARNPSVSGELVVWRDDRHGDHDIYLYDLAAGKETRITTNSSNQEWADISGRRIVYEDYRDRGVVAEIYLYDLGTGKETRLTNDPAMKERPRIWGDKVVWRDYRNGNWDVYLHDLATGKEHQLTTYSGNEDDPNIGENKVVWSSSARGDQDVYVARLTVAPLRAWGPTRYETAVAIAELHPTLGRTSAVIATGLESPDALCASGIAGVLDAPLFLVTRDEIPAALVAELEDRGAEEVLLIGGPGAISPAVEEEFRSLGYDVERIGGADRYETAALVAERVAAEMGEGFGHAGFVVRGDEFPDALVAAPVAYHRRMPILLTHADRLTPTTAEALRSLELTQTVVAGGPGVVGEGVQAELDALLADSGGGPAMRWWGPDRYATAVAVATQAVERKWASPAFVGFATGLDFPDALAGGAATGHEYGVLLLAPGDTLPLGAASFLEDNVESIGRVEAFGGSAVLSDGVIERVEAIVNE